MMEFLRLIVFSALFLGLCVGILIWKNPLKSVQSEQQARNARQTVVGRQCHVIVMYGASWCGVCKMRKQEMTAQHIAFKEYQVDRDPRANDIFLRKIRGTELEHYGYPTFEVNGQLYKNYDPAYLVEQSCL